MCLNPLRKANPYFKRGCQSKIDNLRHIDYFTGELSKRGFHFTPVNIHSFRHNGESAFINIPCGHCSECVAIKQQSYVQRVYEETKFNHVFFSTLTYDNAHLPSCTVLLSPDKFEKREKRSQKASPVIYNPDGTLNESAVAEILKEQTLRLQTFEQDLESSGGLTYESPNCDYFPDKYVKTIPYADIHHLQLMFKRMRDNNELGRSFRYIAVSERGAKRARPHFHIMFLVPKQQGDDVTTCETLNGKLKDMLLKYWSTNVGTRKNPVYERNFTLRQRWIDNKLYRNFDCHYVNPVLSTNGVNDVTYYVTKYMFKESKREEELRKMLFKYLAEYNDDGVLDLTLFHQTWDVVKSRMVCSKGLGLDGQFQTIYEQQQELKPCDEYARESIAMDLSLMEDLPSDDFVLQNVSRYETVLKKRRVLVYNPVLVQKIKADALLEKVNGRFVFVNYNGDHFSLAKYYQDRCLSEFDFVDLYYSTKPEFYPDPFRADNLSSELLQRKESHYKKCCDLIEQHEILDARLEEVSQLGQDVDLYSPYRSNLKCILGIGLGDRRDI